MMTQEQFASAYEAGYQRTTGFLRGKGLPESEAAEAAQAAWVRGWECREQLRDSSKAFSWVNSIALNLFRMRLRSGRRTQELPEIAVPPEARCIELDVERMLHRCKPKERKLLEAYYLERALIPSAGARRWQARRLSTSQCRVPRSSSRRKRFGWWCKTHGLSSRRR